jgi:hypothetical protein
MKFVIPMTLVFSFVAMAFAPSENLYAQFLPPSIPPNIIGDRTHVFSAIGAIGNDESPLQSNTANGDDNRLQNCGKTATGEDNDQFIECQQNTEPERGTIILPSPFDN